MVRALYGLALVGIALLVATPTPAHADALDDALAGIRSGDGDRLVAAIGSLGPVDDPRALELLHAIESREARYTADAVLVRRDDRLVDVRTGQPVAANVRGERVTVNNAVRRALRPAIALQQLGSDDSAVRAAAAAEFRQSPNPDLLETMRSAVAREQNGDIRRNLELAIAQVDLGSSNHEQRLAAVRTIAQYGDVDLKPVLQRLVASGPDGSPVESDEEVHAAASRALRSLENRQFAIDIAASLFYGVSLGSVLLLAALGLAITFGLMRVINMAHGEMLMIGAYSTYVVQRFFQDQLPFVFDFYLLAAIPFAFAVCTLFGMAMERLVIRHLYGRPLETLLATWGISLLLIQAVRLTFGAQNVAVVAPSWLQGGYEAMPGVVFSYNRLAIILFVILVVAFVVIVLTRTSLGLHVRAVMQNRGMAATLGVPTRLVDMWTFGIGSGVAGLGGVALSQIGNVGPELGQSYIVDSFMVVVLGGVGNVFGTVAGASLLGLANKLLEPVAGAVLGKILVLIMIVLFIQTRPQGLIAMKGRGAVEA